MLRRRATPTEKRLWNFICAPVSLAASFRRQFPIGGFILDFCCRPRRLVMEFDGSQHADVAGVTGDKATNLREIVAPCPSQVLSQYCEKSFDLCDGCR
jgi:very-short-patch-repair endonuclease